MSDGPDFYDDVPTGNAIVKSTSQAQTLARKIAGELPPNECRFHCITCGWSKTLEFDEEEIEVLGDIRDYGGPCPGCDSMTLVPYEKLLGGDIKTINDRAKETRREEFKEQADVFVDRIKEEVAAVATGTIFDGAGSMPTAAETSGGTTREEYPDASDVDVSNLKPREG
jgi:hypothetical protein